MILELCDDHVRLRIGARAITVAGATRPDGPDGPDFVIYLDAIERWNPPHDSEPLSLDEIRKVAEVAEADFEARGMTVEFE